MQPPYRSFALLELPFTFTHTVEYAPYEKRPLPESSKETSNYEKKQSMLRAHIAKFYDPVQLKECFHDKSYAQSPSFLHHHNHHHHHHNDKSKESNGKDERERANSTLRVKENSTLNKWYKKDNSFNKSTRADRNSYANVKRSRSSSEENTKENSVLVESAEKELVAYDEIINQKFEENNKNDKELYLAIGDNNEYWSENMFSGWCQAQDWSKSNKQTTTLKTTRETTEETKKENVFHCTSPQMLVHGFYRNDLLIRVHEVKRIHRVRDAVTGEIIREWESEIDEATANTSKQIKDETNNSSNSNNNDPYSNSNVTETSKEMNKEISNALPGVSEPHVEIIGVVSRELQIARPADFVFSLAPTPLNYSTYLEFNNSSSSSSTSRYSSDLFPPARLLGERTPYEVRYEMGRGVNYTVAEHVAHLHDLAYTSNSLSISKNEQNGKECTNVPLPSTFEESHEGDRSFADFRQRVESGFVDTLMVSAHNTNLPPSELLPVQMDFLTQHECQISKTYIEQRQNSTNRNTSAKVIRRAIISITGPLPELMILNQLLQQRPLWIAGMLSEAMLYSGVCPRANFNKQLVNCVTYVIGTGAFNRLRVRMNMNPFANIRSVIYQRLMIRLLRRSEQGTLLRDAFRSPYLTSALAVILQRHKAWMDEYRSYTIHSKEEEEEKQHELVKEDDNKNNNNNTQSKNTNNSAINMSNNNNNICSHYPLTLIEVMCNVIKRGSLYITLQLIDVLDDALIATLVWNHIAPTLQRNSRHHANTTNSIAVNHVDDNNSNTTIEVNKGNSEDVKTEIQRETNAISYAQRDVAKENVKILWSVLHQTHKSKQEIHITLKNESINVELPRDERDNPYGWLGQSQYTRITTRFTQALHSFLLDEVMPLLRFFAGSTEQNVMQEQKESVQSMEQPEHVNFSRSRYQDMFTNTAQNTKNADDNDSVSEDSDDDSNSVNASAPSSREASDDDSLNKDGSISSSSSNMSDSDNDAEEEEQDEDVNE